MKVIYGKRQSGKTTKLIKLSAKKWYYIVCSTKQECTRIALSARQLGLDIPFPITFHEFINGQFNYGGGIKGFLIDRADYLLQTLAREVPIEAISIDKGD